MIASWICFDTNFVPLLEMLAHLVDYDLIPDEVDAIRHGIADTDEERDKWYDYELCGRTSMSFSLALDSGTAVLHVRIEAPAELRGKVEMLLEVLQNYEVTPRA